VESKVQALRTGADDYVTKPFAFEELLARVEALGRRPKEITPPVFHVADLVIDAGKHEVQRGGALIELTPKEYAVLEYLARNAGRVMSRTLITEYAWDYHFDPGTNIVDVVINRLRAEGGIGLDADHPWAPGGGLCHGTGRHPLRIRRHHLHCPGLADLRRAGQPGAAGVGSHRRDPERVLPGP
jgi:hypothetical protein